MKGMQRASRFAARSMWAGALVAIGLIAATEPAAAHNPIFTPGPHLVYGGGLETTIGYARGRASGAGERETEQEVELELEYGLTADWTAEIALPYLDKDNNGDGSSGLGDIVLRSRYRFSGSIRPDCNARRRSSPMSNCRPATTTARRDSAAARPISSAGCSTAMRAGAGITTLRRGTGSTPKAAADWKRVTASSSTWSAVSVRSSPAISNPTRWSSSSSIGRMPVATSSTAPTSPTPAVGSCSYHQEYSRPIGILRSEPAFKFQSRKASTAISQPPITGSSSN